MNGRGDDVPVDNMVVERVVVDTVAGVTVDLVVVDTVDGVTVDLVVVVV